jgi:predicted HicB family RNase H-like nuclease
LVTFEGETEKELTEAFHYVIVENFKNCEAKNIAPEKSYNGNFNIRISPELHRLIAVSAKMHGVSINKFISEVIYQTISH